MSIQMERHRTKHSQRMIDVADYCPLRSNTLLVAAHFVLAVGQRQRVDSKYRVSGKQRVAVQRLTVFAFDVFLRPGSFVERDVTRRKRVVEVKRFRDLAGDKSVLRSRHSVIQLGK